MADLFKVNFTPRGLIGSLPGADTLFGALCWAVRDNEGEEFLSRMLEEFITAPPFLISSMLPSGFLPVPRVPAALVSGKSLSRKDKLERIKLQKQSKKREWIGAAEFAAFQSSGTVAQGGATTCSPFVEHTVTRTAISRETGTVLEGQLYSQHYLAYRLDTPLTVYVRVFDPRYNRDFFERIFHTMGASGIGKDRSVGVGIFDASITELDAIEKKIMDKKGAAFCSLSPCAGIPDPIRYTVFTKYGKVSNQFFADGVQVPFKKPVVLFKEGSTFRTAPEVNPGCMLRNIHSDHRILQYAWAFPVFFDYSEGGL